MLSESEREVSMFEGYAYVVCLNHANASFKIKVGLESLISNYTKNSSL